MLGVQIYDHFYAGNVNTFLTHFALKIGVITLDLGLKIIKLLLIHFINGGGIHT